MPYVDLVPDWSSLVIIDVQPVLTKTIFEVERVLSRIAFLAKVARLLEIPIFTTEQNPSRMGATHESLQPLIDPARTFSKMSFDAGGCREFLLALEQDFEVRKQVVIVGLETHICVAQTAQGLKNSGYEVVVCPDAVSARTQERHKLGMERIRDAGCVPAHTESVAYEWLGSAEHPLFKQALQIVKEHP